MENKALNPALIVWEFLRSQIGPRPAGSHGPYGKVSTEADLASQETLLEHQGITNDRSSINSDLYRGCVLSAKCMFFITYVLLAYSVFTAKGSGLCVLGNEAIFDDPPVVYESVRFQRAGFHDHRHYTNTQYEGPPNHQNEAAWDRLLSAGVVAISEQESSRITNGTASAVGNPKKHIVELEMFHQFHCLKWLRDQFWHLNAVVTASHEFDDFPQRVNHTDHCIDYLRQVIMCHGDITPITFEWIPEIDGYIAHHSTEHMCRNFDTIFDWSVKRNTTGLEADGKHQNKELKHAEHFD
ncbi:uncharacterized protein CTRU02_213874 [Colletotrichum truncatum]|uniref:Uncharacterized protein n=1 Tax=Colletotrichum truncatum TaxID=5467 RepID=A0ACC3YH09_COLTU|nr:uncharacterized protein CTRU02_12895 [Colletotrichum truncatum]KAF6784128.1 hypothetical protein CTRU02_12895 [Colletotrichum truncatum]